MKLLELYNEVVNGENLKSFYTRFKNNNVNPDFLDNNFKNPDFQLRLVHEGGVKTMKVDCAMPNKCETNTFNFIANKVKSDDHRFYPVSGWAFMKSTLFFEHFWVYDAVNDLFLDITPMSGELPYAYGGVINKNINDEISKADKYYDIKFLLGKVASSLYYKHIDNDSNVKLNSYEPNNDSADARLFDFIKNSPKYELLSQFIDEYNLVSLEDLSGLIPKIKERLYTVRNNKEYDMYTTIINQIKSLI